MRKFEQFRDKFIDLILEKPWQLLCLGLVPAILFATGLLNITSDFTPRIWFHPESEQVQNLNLFERRFGGDQFIALGIHNGQKVIGKEFLDTIVAVTEELQYLENVVRVDSLSNFNFIETQLDDINITPLVGDDFDVKEVQRKSENLDEIKNSILSESGEYSLIYARLAPLFESSPNYGPVIEDLKNRLRPYEKDGYRFFLLGNVSVTQAFRDLAWHDNITIMPVAISLIILILFLFYRSVISVFASLIVAFITITSTLGLVGHIGIVYNSILGAIPAILLAICLADTIHIMTSFYQQFVTTKDLKESLRFSMKKNFLATILTSITTAVSFFTISFSDLMPIQDLGILAGIGCILAWLYTYIFLAPIFLVMPLSWVKVLFYERKTKVVEASRFAGFIMKWKTVIISFFVIISVVSVYLGSKNEVNSDPIKYFSKSTRLMKDYMFTKGHMSGIRGLDLVIDSGATDGAKNPEFLNKVDGFVERLTADSAILKVSSILDSIKRMNQELNGGDKAFSKIPETQKKVAESLFLYTLGLPAGAGIENQMTVDNRFIKLTIKWGIEGTKESMIKEKEVHAIAKVMGLNLHTGGFFPLYTKVNDLVVDSFFYSMSMAIILVSLIIFLFFKDLGLALLAMLPNVIPLAIGAGIMSLMGVYLDIGTSIVAAICLGIAVDDTIHFVTHYATNRKKSGDTFKALNETYRSTGQALILTTILLVVGFGMFVFSEFLPNHYFGILCATVLSVALITDLLFLPAILATFYKK